MARQVDFKPIMAPESQIPGIAVSEGKFIIADEGAVYVDTANGRREVFNEGGGGEVSPSSDYHNVIVEGSRFATLPTNMDTKGTLVDVHAGKDALSGAKLAVQNSNLMSLDSFEFGRVTIGTFTANITVAAEDSAEIRVAAYSNTSNQLRIKLTNGLVGTTATTYPETWRSERISLSDIQTFFALCNVREDANFPPTGWVNFVILYADGSASTVLQHKTALSGGGFMQSQTTAGKEIAALCLSVNTIGVASGVNFTLYRGFSPISGNSDFIAPNTRKYDLPSVPAFGKVSVNTPIDLPAGAIVNFESANTPYKATLRYLDTKHTRLSNKTFGYSSVPGLQAYHAPDGIFADVSVLNNMTYDSLIALYETMRTADSGYITRKEIGLTSTGKTMYAYSFTPAKPLDSIDNDPAKLPKITITAGIHSDEGTAWYGTYLLMKQLSQGWQDDELIKFLRFNVNFVVVPIINDQMNRLNINGVNLNRSFYPNWEATTESGAYPLVESEAQAIYKFLVDNLDTDFHIDMHNFYTAEPRICDFYMNGEDGSNALDFFGREIKKIAWSVAYL